MHDKDDVQQLRGTIHEMLPGVGEELAALAETYPEAEIMLYGLSEPQALIHAPNESVAPSEVAPVALAEALFLRAYAPS